MLSKESILQAAESMVKTDGLENLSMRRLAAKLGVKAMSLYNHIKNKDHLIDLLLDDVVSKIALPEQNGSWQKEMIERAMSAHQVFLGNPWALIPLLSRINNGPNMLRYIDKSLACLALAGFSLQEADRILNYFDSYIYGFTLIELKFPIRAEDYNKTTEEMITALPQKDYPAMYKLSLSLLQGDYDGKQDFTSGIETIIKGLEIKLMKGD